MGRPKKNFSTASAYVPKKVGSLPGSADILAGSDPLDDAILRKFQRVCNIYGFSKAELPVLEELRLYEQFYRERPHRFKQVCSLSQSQNIAVRSGILPSLLRAYYEHKLFEQGSFQKFHYSGFVSKLDHNQGIVEQDLEFGMEIFGNFGHLAEAQVIASVWELLRSLGLNEAILEINNIGDANCQKVYQESLGEFLQNRKLDLCDACHVHLQNRPLNVLRCDRLDCRAVVSEAPTVLDFLSEDSNKHFTNILEALDELGIAYQLNPLYAGAAGHSRTNFAIKYKVEDKTVILGEGGYHDDLIQNLCGKNYCCFGFVGSLLVLKRLVVSTSVLIEQENLSEVFLVPLGELAAKRALKLFRDLTMSKVVVYDNFGHVGVKNQLKAAEAQKAPIALIIGQKEAVEEMVILRDVKSGMQEIISYDKIVEEVKKRLGR
ncbi:MAG: ATP phosphoribosyltransferase regulatory subunit [Candidatus Doudnabacteria bacterium]|nr:ATP phosphoribosyltransferase regulatory subunit [Candidatus Doudnabacteria bacterium]